MEQFPWVPIVDCHGQAQELIEFYLTYGELDYLWK